MRQPHDSGLAEWRRVIFNGAVAHLMLHAPAKLNLFLAITGRRSDGFHDLVSVVTCVEFGDTLGVEPHERAGEFTLSCTDPEVPNDDSNLVLRAAQLFAEATGWRGGAHFRLEKRVPMGAGLGGGSSDGVAALRGLNTAAGSPLSAGQLAALAARLGSDCPLFLADGPVVMRGRGERVERLAEAPARRLAGRRVLLFKPPFGVPTAWAYRRLAEMAGETGGASGSAYLPATDAECRLREWLQDPAAPIERLLFNTLERPAFGKYVALPTLLERLQRDHGISARMTGSGSACFAVLPGGLDAAPVTATIRDAWGNSAFVIETRTV